MTLLLIALIVIGIACSISKANKEAENQNYLKNTKTNVELERQIRKKWDKIITDELRVPIGEDDPWVFLQKLYEKYGVPWCSYLSDEHDQKKDYEDAMSQIESAEKFRFYKLRTKEEIIANCSVKNGRSLDYIAYNIREFEEYKNVTKAEILEIIKNSNYGIMVRRSGFDTALCILYDKKRDLCVLFGGYGNERQISVEGVKRYSDFLKEYHKEIEADKKKYDDTITFEPYLNYFCYVVTCSKLHSKYNQLKNLLSKLELRKAGFAPSRDGIHESDWQEADKLLQRKKEYEEKYPDFKNL